jgi:dienelactone hydrolase
VCAIFGGADDLVPTWMVEDFRRLLARRPDHEVHVLPGGHLFANEARRRHYHPRSAEMGWAVALDFLGRHLDGRSPPPPVPSTTGHQRPRTNKEHLP